MKERKLAWWTMGLVVAVAALLALPGAGSAQQAAKPEFVLKLATNHPVTHVGTIAGSEFFIKKVQDGTNGRVKIEFYPGEQLAKFKDMLDVVSSGRADMTYVLTSLVPGTLPLSTVAELPGLFSDPRIAVKAYRKLVEKRLYEAEVKRFGILPLIPIEWSQTVLFTSKPVKSLDDLKGLKIAANGLVQVEAVKAMGAIPVLVPNNEVYESIQRKVTDGALNMFNNAEAYKINEVCNYAVVGIGWGGYAGYFPINEKSWAKLPDDVKKVMQAAALETSDNVSRVSNEKEATIMEAWAKKGMNIYQIPANELPKWQEKMNAVQEKWVKDMEARKLPAQAVLDEWKQYLKEFSK